MHIEREFPLIILTSQLPNLEKRQKLSIVRPFGKIRSKSRHLPKYPEWALLGNQLDPIGGSRYRHCNSPGWSWCSWQTYDVWHMDVVRCCSTCLPCFWHTFFLLFFSFLPFLFFSFFLIHVLLSCPLSIFIMYDTHRMLQYKRYRIEYATHRNTPSSYEPLICLFLNAEATTTGGAPPGMPMNPAVLSSTLVMVNAVILRNQRPNLKCTPVYCACLRWLCREMLSKQNHVFTLVDTSRPVQYFFVLWCAMISCVGHHMVSPDIFIALFHCITVGIFLANAWGGENVGVTQ